MDINQISIALTSRMEVTPTPSQVNAINEISRFILTQENIPIFILNGYAGTGKTFLISTLIGFLESHGHTCHLMAPTGRAAKVFSSFAKKEATTIHKKIYYPATETSTKPRLQRNKQANSYFFVDEASLIATDAQNDQIGNAYNLFDDLLTYVFENDNCKLFLIGDTAQLPPIGFIEPNALKPDFLKRYSDSIFYATLTDVVRQLNESTIVHNATYLRECINEQNCLSFPQFKKRNKKDFEMIGGDELIECLTKSYDQFGHEETMVITRSNKRAVAYNLGIRNSVLFKEEEITVNDILMVTKNNYYWTKKMADAPFIANGDLLKVERVKKIENLYGFRFANLTVSFLNQPNFEIEVKVILDSLSSESPSLTSEQQKKLEVEVYNDYFDVTSESAKRNKVMEDPYFNALQVKYGYAMTCHKAQGGQWSSVFVDQGYITEEMINIDYYKWLYTAFTRAQTQLTLVNFNESK